MPSSISSSERAPTTNHASGLTVLARGFVLTLLLLIAASEFLVRSQVLPQDTRAAHLSLLRSAPQSNAVFGDSHAARGFAAQGSFVNLAYPSENIEDMFAKVRAHFASRAPGQVVLQADPHLFAAYRVFASAKSTATQNAPTLHITTHRHRPQLNAYWQAFAEGFGTLQSTVHQSANGALLSQGDFSSLAPRAQDLEARTRIRHHALAPTDAVAQAQNRYEQMLTFLSNRGAAVCLVSFPVTQAYRTASAASEAAGHASAVRFFQKMATRQDARYVDARALVAPDHLFRDVDHLNAEGAQQVYGSILQRCFG